MIQIEDRGEVRVFRLARTWWGKGLYFTAAYYVDGLLIDTGCRYTVAELVAAVKDLPLSTIVNTHTHEDHIAANAELQHRRRLPVLVHALGLPVLHDPRGRQKLRPYQRVMWGWPQPSEGTPIGQTVDTPRFRFQVIYTPGHSRDHICLFEPNRGWLFSGDAFVGGRDKAIRADYNIWQIIESLKKMLVLHPQVNFPGSGRPREKAAAEIRAKIDYLEETGARIEQMHRQGLSRRRIRRKIFGRELTLYYFTLGNFSGKNLVRSYLEDRPDK